MDSAIIVAAIAGIVSLASAYFAATRSQRKQPEDRDAVIAETTERVLRLVRAELEECLKIRDVERITHEAELDALTHLLEKMQADRKQDNDRITSLKGRVTKLERQLRALGHEPENGA